MHLLDNVILILFLSFVVGVMVDPILRRMAPYESLSRRYLFSDSKTYESLGVLRYRDFLLATPFGSFNRDIHFSTSRDLKTLERIRDHMATAEMSHWVGFIAMLIVNGIAWWYRGPVLGLAYLSMNLLGNIYPCLLQQYNKRRLERLILVIERRSGDSGQT